MATVTPGKVFAEGEYVTTTKLNQLGNPIVALDEDDTAAVVESVRQTIPTVNRNVLINGNFDVWQRGGYTNLLGLPTAMGTGAGADMGADRWFIGTPSGSSKRQVYQGTFDAGQTAVPNSPQYYLRWEELVAETGSYRPVLAQYLENVRTFAGKEIVVTWWMRGNYSGNVTCRLEQFTGGSPGQSRYITATSGGTAALTADAEWQQYTATFTVTGLLGFAVTSGSTLGLQFLLPDNTTFIIDFAQVQMEEGTTATPFEVQPYLEVVRKCERYFEYHGGVAHDDITHGGPCYYFATRKYRAPTLTLIAGYTGTMTAANFSTILDVGYFQDTANSTISAFFMACEAEINMP